jgi:hypothetical protein
MFSNDGLFCASLIDFAYVAEVGIIKVEDAIASDANNASLLDTVFVFLPRS